MAPMLYVAAVQRGARKPTPPVDEIAGLQRKILKLEREAAARETELNTARRVAAARIGVLTKERDEAREERGVPFEELYRVKVTARVEAQEEAAADMEDLKQELRGAKMVEDELGALRWRSVSAALGSSDAAARHWARPLAVWKRLQSRLTKARLRDERKGNEIANWRQWYEEQFGAGEFSEPGTAKDAWAEIEGRWVQS